jgi:hypothetical protein
MEWAAADGPKTPLRQERGSRDGLARSGLAKPRDDPLATSANRRHSSGGFAALLK